MGTCFSGKNEKSQEGNQVNFAHQNLKKDNKEIVVEESIKANPEVQAISLEEEQKESLSIENEKDTISKNIFDFINDLRSEPNKYIKDLYELMEKYNRDENALFLENNIIKLPENCNPIDGIKFLQNASPKKEIILSEKVKILAMDEMDKFIHSEDETNYKELSKNSFIITHDYSSIDNDQIRIFINFILSPMQITLCMFILSEEIRKILFNKDLVEGAVVLENKSENNPDITLLYLLLNKN